MAEPEYPVLQELETKLKLQWVDTNDAMATQRAIIEVTPDHAYLELPRGRKGDKGDPGNAISFQGIVARTSDLPAGLGASDAAKAWVNTATKALHVWNGNQWFTVNDFAGVDADVQKFSQWFAQMVDAARAAVDAADRAEYWANETIQQVTGDFATKNYVDAGRWHQDVPNPLWNIEDFPKGIWKIENAEQRTRLGLPNSFGVLVMHVYSPDRQSVQNAKAAYWLSLSHSSPTRMLIRSTDNLGVWEPGWRNTFDGYEPPSKQAAVPLTFPSGSSYSDDRPTLTIRIPFKFGAAVKRARLRLRNYDYRSNSPFPGAYRIVGAGIGKHQINDDGSMTGLVPEGESITQLMGSIQKLDSTEAAGEWVDVDLEPNTDYLLSYSFTADDGMIYTRQTAQCFTNRLSTGWNRVGSVTATPSNMAVLSAILDVEVSEDTPVYGYLGDSQTAAISAARPGYDSWAMVHSRLAGAIPTIHGHAGGGLNEWQSSSKPAYGISDGMAKFDRMHISMGSNDISGGRPFTGVQEYLTNVMQNWRNQADTFVLHNYLPRTGAESSDTVRQALNDWVLNDLPGNALYSVDVYDATVDHETGLMDERWRGSINDVHMNSAGNARVAMATFGGTSGGDFATRNYVDALDPKIDRGTGEIWLTLADTDRIDTIEPGFYTIRQGAGIALGMPVEGTGQLNRTWLNPEGTSQIDLYHLLVDGKFQSWSRRKTSSGWQPWERDAGEVIAEEIKAGYDPIERGTGEKWLTAGDASRMDTLEPGTYTVVTSAGVYLDMPTTERGALRRFWLTPTGNAKLDLFFAEIDGQLHIWSRTFFAGAWQGWNKHGGVIKGLDDNDVLHAITNDEGHVLQSFRRDGTVLIPGLTGNSIGTGFQFIDGNLTPTDTDMTHMVGWGSSTMNWLSYELSKIAKTIGAEYHNQGKGGEIGDATVARLGSRPALVTFPNNQIPSTAGTEVQVTISNVEAHGNPAPFMVTVEGVEGTLEMRVDKWYFTKLRTGPVVPLDGPVLAIPTEGRRLQGAFTVLNLGKNSFNRDIPNMVDYVTDLSIEAFDYLSPISKRSLVLGHFVNAPDLPGSIRQQNVLDVNSRLKSHFGILYVDMQGMLESSRLWEITGISPSSDDLAAQTNRVLPPSVRMDEQHLNDAGLAAVATLVREKMIELNWI